jgi:putative ABC transport system permease protein
MTIYSSIFLAILCGFIIYVIVKRKISESKKSLSILQANGYSKSSIAFSMTTISLFIGILPNMLGYIFGLILQRYMFSVFSSYWTLPYYYQGFSIITMFLIIFIPFIFISLVSYFGSLVTLRGRLIDNINLNTEKPNAFSNYFSKAFFFLPIKPRFSLLLFSKNIVKMLIITAAFAASTSASVIAFSIFGKFDEAKDRTDSVNKYKYRVDLLTPTIEGGQYSALFSTPYPQ